MYVSLKPEAQSFGSHHKDGSFHQWTCWLQKPEVLCALLVLGGRVTAVR